MNPINVLQAPSGMPLNSAGGFNLFSFMFSGTPEGLRGFSSADLPV